MLIYNNLKKSALEGRYCTNDAKANDQGDLIEDVEWIVMSTTWVTSYLESLRSMTSSKFDSILTPHKPLLQRILVMN